MPHRTPPPADTAPAPLDTNRSKFVRFDPTLNTGHVLQIAVFVVGGFAAYGAIKSDAAATKADLDQVKAIAVVERAQTSESLRKIEASVAKLQDSNQDIKESLAILRGRAAEPRGGK
jgi:hypothetical protein